MPKCRQTSNITASCHGMIEEAFPIVDNCNSTSLADHPFSLSVDTDNC